MNENEQPNEPDWDTPLSVVLTPAWLIHALFHTANSVHTGWGSCVDPRLVVTETRAEAPDSPNYCRLVEQEFVEEEGPDMAETTWHDWVVEVAIERVVVTGHWQIPVNSPPLEWDWCAAEAEKAFDKACMLFGKRVGRALTLIEEPGPQPPSGQQPRH